MSGDDRCAACGHEKGEHHYNGNAYGVCGKFVSRADAMTDGLPKPETMLAYASILEKPQYWIDPRGRKWLLATGEIIEAACAALRYCAALKSKG